jgi:hypothetical protein
METKELFIKMVISAWETQHVRVTKLLTGLSDEQLNADTAPGRNSGFYLIGHLTTVSDGLFPLLGWGQRLYPQLEVPFLKSPDKAGLDVPSAKDLRQYWDTVHTKLNQRINETSSDEWFEKHTAVSGEDFLKEPHRNKLNLIINRTNHMSNHLGQLNYLVQK